MKRLIFVLLAGAWSFGGGVFAQGPGVSNSVMSEAYLNFWNPEVQTKIDQEIDRNRKAEAVCHLNGIKKGSEVKIEQISHQFLFGGNIFLFGDLGSPEKNKKYEDTYGNLFNAATVAFYWKTLEQQQGKPRYAAGSSYEYRRPATDPVVAFCESKGINMNGHAIIYGMRTWGHPEWMPDDRKAMEPLFEAHVKELAERYKDRIQRWDVVNESIDQANRGLMPDDYTFKTYSWAMKYFPATVQFNINDCDIHWGPSRRYVEIARDLIDRGIRINNVGVQMHIFNPSEAQRIADGADNLSPGKNYAVLDCLKEADRPIHISEVTVTAPDETPKGWKIQAEIARNLYRLWFSYPSVMGITWWNVVDGGAAKGEPSFSGLYDKELNPKPVYYALDQLINHEWKTNLTLKPGLTGDIRFRGFKGKYRISWKDKSGKQQQAEFLLKQDGDGF
ncbi:MAG TPA: endo-1,4-beta-xylanase [Prolixibacteraceae bacterium]|nr:endo-1,4-beta-xylanase [Prolixibacteraceae bacterium]